MSWPIGLSWTSTHYEMVGVKEVRVQGGPFYFHPSLLGLEVYAGFRPTPPWFSGGNEGLFVPFKRLCQRLGCSNLGFALRRGK